jgi:hypothetical protein
MTRGELEARILDGDRALASAPPDVSRELRLIAQAEADAWQQSADADIRRDPFDTAIEVTTSQLRIELMFPADDDTEAWFRAREPARPPAAPGAAPLPRP